MANGTYTASMQTSTEHDPGPAIGTCTAGRGVEKAHSFQVQVINLPMSMSRASRGDTSATMMFCTKCGAAFLMGIDTRWHRVEVGEPASQVFQPRHRTHPPTLSGPIDRPSAPRFPWSAEGDDG